MSTIGAKLQTMSMEWTANMTEQNHLGAALIAKPSVLSEKMDQLFSAQNYYSHNPLTSGLMAGVGTEEEIDGTSWEWQLKGANTRPAVVIENVEPDGNTQPGLYRRTFKLKLDVDWYLPGDILHPGTSNKKYQVRIQDDVQRHGDGWIYNVVLMTEDQNMFLPVQYLAPGTQWGKLYSQYAEAAEQDGSTQFSMPIAFQNKLGKARKQYRITDYASTEVLAVAIPDSNGAFHKSWIRYAEVEYWQQWYRELERMAWYSRSTDTVPDANGRNVRSGPGIQEQLEDSHIHRYSHLTTKMIEEYLMDIFYSRVKPGQGRNVIGYTGEYGMIQFHRAIQDWVDKGGFIKNVENYESDYKSDLNPNSKQAGFQYVKYNMANGSSLTLVHNPLYDDREINFEIDPVTGYPMESQRITFLDFSGDGGKSNIKYMKKKDGMAFGYVEGLYGPYGPKSGGNMSHSGEYYSMHVSKSCGMHIEDITKCGELILSRG